MPHRSAPRSGNSDVSPPARWMDPAGVCECGCGQPTSIPERTDGKAGRIKGVPMRYVHGHNGKGQRRIKGPDWAVEERGYTTPCLIWQHGRTADGYGKAADPDRPGKQQYTHILAWRSANGPVPAGLELDHLCRVRACGNPEHLEPVTHAENARRGMGGIHGGERMRAKTHCPKGHPYSGANLYTSPSGARSCRECKRAQWRSYYSRRKALP